MVQSAEDGHLALEALEDARALQHRALEDRELEPRPAVLEAPGVKALAYRRSRPYRRLVDRGY